MKTKLIGIFLSILLLSTTLSTATALQPTATQQEIKEQLMNNDASFDRLINILLKFGHYPSMSTCIIKNTTVV